MNSKLRLNLCALVACLCVPHMASAAETGWVNVVYVGGQSDNVFIELSTIVGEQTCRSTRIILTAAAPNTTQGDAQKRLYAAMLAAMNTGGKVLLSLSGCQTTFPTMIATDYWFAEGA